MKLVYTGKTKDVYALDDGNYLLQFKDDVTGADGVFDPGANQVGLSIEGAGRAGLRLSKMFFELLEKEGVPTHYLGVDLEKATMTVKPAAAFGNGVEVICRYRAVGSFIRRYGMYVEEGQPLDAYVEFTLKDDDRGDPLITEDGLAFLNLLTLEDSAMIKELTRKICALIRAKLATEGIELYDIKLEFGRVEENDRVVLIDEISGGNMRAYRDGKRLEPLDLERALL
jgi:phosphoribosylaminoimidazole-succinocarboxamide synthase